MDHLFARNFRGLYIENTTSLDKLTKRYLSNVIKNYEVDIAALSFLRGHLDQ